MQCPYHDVELKVIPPGVSKKTGKPYNQLYASPESGCNYRPQQTRQNYNPVNRTASVQAVYQKQPSGWDKKVGRQKAICGMTNGLFAGGMKHAELVVGSLEYEFGRKLEGIAILNGKLTVVDFKTVKSINPDYYVQTAGYAISLSEMGVDVEGRLILRIDKQGKGFEERIVPAPFDCRTFVALRELQKWKSYTND